MRNCGISLKCVVAVAAMALSVVLSAAEEDVLVTFSTRGPDRYADGTSVKAGEVYALVWVREGHAFAGVDLNGAAVDAENSAVVMAHPLAREKVVRGETRGYCPPTLFQVPAAFAATHADGAYALCLMDTRVSSASGLAPSGNPNHVQGWGLVEGARIRSAAGTSAAGALGAGSPDGTTAGTASALPAGEDFPQPRITGIEMAEDHVALKVTGTSPRLLYNVATGATPGRRDRAYAAAAPLGGRCRAHEELTLIVPRRDGQNFFRVVRNP